MAAATGVTAASLAPLMKVSTWLLRLVPEAGAVRVEVPAAVLFVPAVKAAVDRAVLAVRYDRPQDMKTELKVTPLVAVSASLMAMQPASEPATLVNTELMIVASVPVSKWATVWASVVAFRPTRVQLAIFGWETYRLARATDVGAAENSKPALRLVEPAGRWVTMPNWAPPRQPVSVSRPSSSAPVMTMRRRLTLPPKISMPSSELLWTWMNSTVVPEPTPAMVRPCSSLPVEISKPENLIWT